ncbi:DUF2796 domain-containing protein [Hyphomicrobium methylovorum]|uniref:zinc uptake protein ZrgA n=1 Tax=Hyphomicrobium methylovorum TaxID=84 RepID=UPI0015E64797|nr:DUF2796 domain-containing protein [Hyphomicrobium methylovorum]MBA2126766.1 DUF2796 domain-containing protein [Hyphomicrobium methylovorum]
MLKICSGLVVALLVSAPALADETRHRQLGAHVHGTGTLDIVIEGQTVSLELVAPGMDVVGFEHAASSGEQKAAVEKAKASLADVTKLFKFPDAANCKVQTASAETHQESHHEEDHDHNHEGHDGHDHHDKHSHDAADKDGHAGHSEFHATYQLKCDAPDKLTRLDTAYFSEFSGAKALNVTLVSPKGQTQAEMTRDKPMLDLSGAM